MGENKEKVPKEKGKSKRRLIIALSAIVILVAGVIIWWYGDQKAPEIASNELKITENIGSDDIENIAEEAIHVINTSDREEGRYYTLLVVGYDQVKANTDTMMVARIDTTENDLNIVSIPRDTLVNVSWDIKKLNSIYKKTGESIDGLKKGVEDILGFEVDSYAFVDISAFEKIVDCIGGVYFDVPCDMNYSAPDQNLTIDIDKGYQLLDGENALKVCRFRSTYPMADIDRIGVQQDFIKAAIPQILNLGNALKAPKLIKIISNNLQTDLSYGNIKWYMTQFLSIKPEDISIMMMPANTCCCINGGSYVSIYVDDWMEMVNTKLNPYNTEIKRENCNILYQIAAEPSMYTVTPTNYEVTNGSAVAGGTNSFALYKNN